MFNLIFCMKINYFCGNLNSTQSQSTKPCNNDSRETDILKLYIFFLKNSLYNDYKGSVKYEL